MSASSNVRNLRPIAPTTTFTLTLTDLEVSLAEVACRHSESQAVRDVGALLRAQVDEARARQDECNPRGLSRPFSVTQASDPAQRNRDAAGSTPHRPVCGVPGRSHLTNPKPESKESKGHTMNHPTELATPPTAIFVKKLTDFRGDARLYKLQPPLDDGYHDPADHVIVSAVELQFDYGCETYIFAATPEGEVRSWSELEGSLKNVMDHTIALEGAGYVVAS